MLGKSAGIALLLAAALLLTLLAMGVFSPGGAKADGHIHLNQLRVDAGPNAGDTDLDLDPVFDPSDANRVREYELTYSSSTVSMHTIRVNAGQNGASIRDDYTVTMTVTNAEISEDILDNDYEVAHRITGELDSDDNLITQDLNGAVITITVVRADDTETADEDESGTETYTIRVVSGDQEGEIVDTTEATANVRVTLKATLTARVGDEIVLGMKSFGFREDDDGNVNIDPTYVSLVSGSEIASPRDVDVDKDSGNVTVTLGKLKDDAPTSDPANQLDEAALSIIISSRAGITNPVKAGNYWVTIDAKDALDSEGADARRRVSIVRSLNIKPDTAGKGASVVVTGKGFANGSVTVFRDVDGNDMYDPGTDEDVGTAVSAKGVFTLTTTNIEEDSTIQAIDIDGNLGPAGGQDFTLKQSIKVTPTEVFPDAELTIELRDWGTSDGEVTGIRFGGNNGQVIDVEDQGANSTGEKIKVDVPTDVRLGSLKVEAMVGSSSKANQTVTVNTHVLTISPITAVQGQEITIQGSGFGNGQEIDSLTFGSLDSVATSSFNAADSNGNINVTVKVPDDLGSGEQEIKLITENNRSGTAKITVPKAAITISPTEGLRGSMVTVTGTGFPASDLIQLKYDRTENSVTTAQPVTTANTDTTGNFSVSFEIPSFAGIGSTQKITADAQLNTDVADVTVDHSTPKPTMTLTPATASPGSRITISGMNFAGFAPVSQLEIHDRDVKPVPTPATVEGGSISMSGILVPQLDPGRYIVTLVISGKTVTRFLEVTDEPASTDPADVFEPLTTNNNLTVVWHYDNDTKRWSSYSPTAPAALNDLAMVEPGMVVWVQVSGAVQFQGATLNEGWQLIVLK